MNEKRFCYNSVGGRGVMFDLAQSFLWQGAERVPTPSAFLWVIILHPSLRFQRRMEGVFFLSIVTSKESPCGFKGLRGRGGGEIGSQFQKIVTIAKQLAPVETFSRALGSGRS